LQHKCEKLLEHKNQSNKNYKINEDRSNAQVSLDTSRCKNSINDFHAIQMPLYNDANLWY